MDDRSCVRHKQCTWGARVRGWRACGSSGTCRGSGRSRQDRRQRERCVSKRRRITGPAGEGGGTTRPQAGALAGSERRMVRAPGQRWRSAGWQAAPAARDSVQQRRAQCAAGTACSARRRSSRSCTSSLYRSCRRGRLREGWPRWGEAGRRQQRRAHTSGPKPALRRPGSRGAPGGHLPCWLGWQEGGSCAPAGPSRAPPAPPPAPAAPRCGRGRSAARPRAGPCGQGGA